jgi:hypothetical protein
LVWTSSRQRVVALSTLESEYIAAASVTQDLVWFYQLVNELDLPELTPLSLPIVLNCDNQGALTVMKDSTNHSRTKHIDVRYHFLRDQVQCLFVLVHKVQ